MTKTIKKNMLFLVFITIILFSIGTSFLYYNFDKYETTRDIKNQAHTLKVEYDLNPELDFTSVMSASRITLIDNDGTVLYDNKTSFEKLDNHSDREEVIEAKEKGVGQSERYSDNLLDMFYYYAVSLDTGLILRISTTSSSFYSLILLMLPYTLTGILAIFILANIISRRLTYNIVGPIEKADLKSNLVSPYQELDMYFYTMREQKREIEKQVVRVNKRKETINTILNTMQDGFMIVDASKNVFLANHAFLEIVGLHDYEVSDSIYRFINDRVLLSKIDDALNGDSSSHKININDKIYQVYISHTEILNEGVAIVLFVDISLEYENQKLREEFSANVSHELKTPLTSIRGLAELQANNMVDPEDITLFGKKILKQSNRLLEMIEHILNLSKFDEDALDGNKEVFNIKTVIVETLVNLSNEIKEKDITVLTNFDDLMVNLNYRMMDELFYNLIDNAIKYNVEGGYINIDVKAANGITIEVSNSGPLIPSKDAPRLFERFYRVDASRTSKTGGSGLGLSIVKHIVMFHGGSIKVSTEKDNKFIINIPTES